MENRPKFKCRCSSIGKIMTDPREKSNSEKYYDAVENLSVLKEKYSNTPNKNTKTAENLLERIKKLDQSVRDLYRFKDEINLSKTARSVISDWMKDQLGYPRQEMKSKYTQKGLLMEDEAISFAASYYGWGEVKKNTERRENEYITGEPDVVLPDLIDDIKCSWSRDTFPLIDIDIPIDGYGYQGLGYMELFSKKKFQLTYVLMDAPETIVDKEANTLKYQLGLDEVDAELWEEVKVKHTYSHMPNELRIKSFFTEYDGDLIAKVYERVELCRKWIEQTDFYEKWERTNRK